MYVILIIVFVIFLLTWNYLTQTPTQTPTTQTPTNQTPTTQTSTTQTPTEPSLNKQPNGCSKCETGKYNPEQNICIDCLRGTYNDVECSTICKPCPSGTYNLTTGNKSIDSCITSKAGTYIYTGDEFPYPLSCPINTYSGAGATTCTPCDDGYITLDVGSTECIKKNTELKMSGDTTINSYYQFVIKATTSLPIVFNSIKIKFSNITGFTNLQFLSNYKPIIQQIKIYNSSDSQNSIRGINIISPPNIEHNKIVYTLVPYTVPTSIDTNQYLELLFYFSPLQGFTFDNKIYYEITLNNCDNLLCPVIPVDCEISEWSDWSICSALCGYGTQTRTRNILTPAYNGGNCDIQLSESRECIIKNCPIDCKYTLSDWGDCSATCGGGTMSRTMTIEQQPLYGGKECPNIELTTSCNDSACINYDYVSEYESSYSRYISGSNTDIGNIQISSTLPSKIYLKRIDIEFSNSQNTNLINSYSIYSSNNKLQTGISYIWVEKTKGLYESQPSNKTYIIYRNNTFTTIDNGSELYLTLFFTGLNNQYLQVSFNYKVTLFYDKDTDCVLSPITWSDCSVTCGGGTRTGTQTIIAQPKYNGMICPTNLTITEQCNLNMCPISTNKPIPEITFSNLSYPYYLSNIFAGNPMNFNTNSYTLSGFKNTVSRTFFTKQDNRININSMSFFTNCKSVEYPKQFNKDIYCYLVGIKFTEYGSNIVSAMVYDSTINNFVFAQNDNILNSTNTSYFNKINNILISSKQYESSGITLNSKLIKLSNLNVNYVSSIEFIYNLYTENTFTTTSTLSFDINITEIVASSTDCLLSNWGNWGDCSVPCGNGTQTRTKTILQNSLFEGQPCSNFIMSENQNCNNGVCVASFVAGGNSSSNDKIIYSVNGMDNWTGLGNTYFDSCNCIKYANNKWVIGGRVINNYGNVMYQSTNGVEWTKCTLSIYCSNISTISYGAGIWLAMGINISNQYNLFVSIDGSKFDSRTMWDKSISISLSGKIVNSIEYNNNLWIIGGNNNPNDNKGFIYYSTNYTNSGGIWTLQTLPFNVNKIKYINNIWIILGKAQEIQESTGISYSTNGTIWIQVNTTGLYFTSSLIEYINNKYIINSVINGSIPLNSKINNIEWTNIYVDRAYQLLSLNTSRNVFVGYDFNGYIISRNTTDVKFNTNFIGKISCIETNNL